VRHVEPARALDRRRRDLQASRRGVRDPVGRGGERPGDRDLGRRHNGGTREIRANGRLRHRGNLGVTGCGDRDPLREAAGGGTDLVPELAEELR
jgi:hypothetical protein